MSNEIIGVAPIATVDAMPTLKQIAIVLDCQVERIRNVAKKPIAGQFYDPKAINWDAVKAFISNRLDKTGYDSVEAILVAANEVEILNTHVSAGKKAELLSIEGSDTTPQRKCDLAVGDIVHDKKTDADYEVKYFDETIVVFAPISENGGLTLSQAIGNRNFNSRFTVVK